MNNFKLARKFEMSSWCIWDNIFQSAANNIGLTPNTKHINFTDPNTELLLWIDHNILTGVI